jgi:hypothetical protein
MTLLQTHLWFSGDHRASIVGQPMVSSNLMRLKVNWFPVQIPQGNLRVNGVVAPQQADYRSFRHVRQYRFKGQWLAVCVAPGEIPAGFREQEVGSLELPRMTSTLISEAFLHYYEQQGFTIERRKGQNMVFHARTVENLPEGITFYEGLLVKPFYIDSDQRVAFGLVIDFATHQAFTESIANDPAQRQLAAEGHEVYVSCDNGTYISGFLRQARGSEAIIERHGSWTKVRLYDVRVKANYRAVGEYVERSRTGRARDVIRLLMVESLSLSKSGFANVDRLTEQYLRVAELLGRNQSANINITLPTLCQSVISVATEPADLELRPV